MGEWSGSVWFGEAEREPIVLFCCDSNWLISGIDDTDLLVSSANDAYPNEARAFCQTILAASLVTGEVIYSLPPGDSRIFRQLTEQNLLIEAIEALGFSITYTNLSTAEGYIILPLLNPTSKLTTAERDNIRNQGRRYGAFLMGEHAIWGSTSNDSDGGVNFEVVSIFKDGWITSDQPGEDRQISTGQYGTATGPIAETLSADTGTGTGWFDSGPSVSGPETLAYVVNEGVLKPSMVDLNFDRIAPAG